MSISVRFESYERDDRARSKLIAKGEIAAFGGSRVRSYCEENVSVIFPVPVTIETLKFDCGDKVHIASLMAGRIEFIDEEAPANRVKEHLLRGLNLNPCLGVLFCFRSKSSASEKIAFEMDAIVVHPCP